MQEVSKEYKITVTNKDGSRNSTTYYVEERALREIKRLQDLKKKHGQNSKIKSAELRTIIIEKIV